MNFKEWFDRNLTVGGFPIKVNLEFMPAYKYVINMSDEFYPPINNDLLHCNCKPFWFPMNERRRDIGLNSIFGAMVIMFQAEKENATVYLHCHSGRNRSMTVKACYYFMRTGTQINDPSRDKHGNLDGKYRNRLHRSSTRGYLPPMTEMEAFLNKLGKTLVANNMNDRILDDCKKEINNF